MMGATKDVELGMSVEGRKGGLKDERRKSSALWNSFLCFWNLFFEDSSDWRAFLFYLLTLFFYHEPPGKKKHIEHQHWSGGRRIQSNKNK